MSEAEDLLAHFQAALPGMKANWQRLIDKGYQARLEGKPRMYHGRRQRGSFFRGWDAADADIKAGKCEEVKNES
jgi:ribosome modulation factor